MSKQTDEAMLDAIAAHFADEAVKVENLKAVRVSVLGDLAKYGVEMPAHYRTAISHLHDRALHGSLPSTAGADGPVVNARPLVEPYQPR